jgi:hypothetical protein
MSYALRKGLTCAAAGCSEVFDQIDHRQIYHSKKCASRERVKRFRDAHKADTPPPGKPPGTVKFGRPKISPAEASLFEVGKPSAEAPAKARAAA